MRQVTGLSFGKVAPMVHLEVSLNLAEHCTIVRLLVEMLKQILKGSSVSTLRELACQASRVLKVAKAG